MTLDSSAKPCCQTPSLYSLLCMLQVSDLPLPWLGFSVQTCRTCQSAQSSSGSVWPAAALCLSALSLQDKLTTQSSANSQVASNANTHVQTCTSTYIHIHRKRHTHLLIPFSLIPHNSSQIFPSADLIVRECGRDCVYVCIGGRGSTAVSLADAWVHPVFRICTPTVEENSASDISHAAQGAACHVHDFLCRSYWTVDN